MVFCFLRQAAILCNTSLTLTRSLLSMVASSSRGQDVLRDSHLHVPIVSFVFQVTILCACESTRSVGVVCSPRTDHPRAPEGAGAPATAKMQAPPPSQNRVEWTRKPNQTNALNVLRGLFPHFDHFGVCCFYLCFDSVAMAPRQSSNLSFHERPKWLVGRNIWGKFFFCNFCSNFS